jgi:hypothetical protein
MTKQSDIVSNDDLVRRVLAEIEKSPGAEALTPAFAERLAVLTEGIDVDFDENIEGEISLQPEHFGREDSQDRYQSARILNRAT